MAQLFDIKKVTVGPKNLDAVVEVAPSAPLYTDEDLIGTTLVYNIMPDIANHLCLGDSSECFGDVMGATELAHLLEHVTVELLARTNIAGDIACGQTTQVGERTFQLTFPCPDDVLVAGALSSAAWIMQWAFSGGGDPAPDVDATADGLVALVESLGEVRDDDLRDGGASEDVAEPQEIDAYEQAYVVEDTGDFEPEPSPEPELPLEYADEGSYVPEYPPEDVYPAEDDGYVAPQDEDFSATLEAEPPMESEMEPDEPDPEIEAQPEPDSDSVASSFDAWNTSNGPKPRLVR